MAKVMSNGESYPQLPPTDRELALRAQIKTGWSTYYKSTTQFHRHNLSNQEVKVIQEVVERAQAMDHMEEIRIGLLMLKHKQMLDNCRGDGVSTCRICNRDFTSRRTNRPEPVQYCQDCQMVICSRCKNICKMVTEQDRILCTVCYNERELWKKSGAWLDNSAPSVSIPQKDLEELQQQQQTKTTKVTIGHKRESTALMNIYHDEDESDDDDNNLEASISSKSRIQFNRSPDPSPILKRKNSPIPEIATPRAKQLDAAFSGGAKSSSDSEDQRSITSKTRSISRKAGLSRKGAIAGAERGRLQKSRERANSRSNSPASHSRSTSPSSNPDVSMVDREHAAIDVTSSLLPSIKVSSIPNRSPPTLSTQHDRNSTPESENDSPKKRVIRQMHTISSTDSESIHVATHEPLAISKEDFVDQPFSTRSQNSEVQPDGGKNVTDIIDEFKKVKAPPTKPPPTKEPPKMGDNEFRKVKTGIHTRKPQSSEEPALKSETEFRRINPSTPPQGSPLETRTRGKVARMETDTVTPPAKPPPVMNSSEEVKVKSSTTGRATKTPEKEAQKSTTMPKESGSSKTARGLESFGDEFKKVGARSNAQPSGANDAGAKSEKTGDEEQLFRKVPLPRSEQKPVAVRRKVLPDPPSSGPPTIPSSSPSQPKLPPSGGPSPSGRSPRPVPPSGPAPPLPEKPGSGYSVSNLGSDLPLLADAGKQSSITSVGSSVPSEYNSAGFEVDSGMASPSSLGSTDSMETSKIAFDFEKQQHHKESLSESLVSDGTSSQGFGRPPSMSRRNASRSGKRPPPRPNLDGDESQQPKQDQGDAGTFHTRPRARSRVVRKRPEAHSGGSEDLQQVGENEETGLGELPVQRRTRARATVVTSADRPRARASSSKSDGDQSAPKWKADGSFGSVQLTLLYEESTATLNVTVHGCRGLRAMDSNGKSDPYVKLFLQPGNKMQRFQTKVVPKNLNPSYQETFSFDNLTLEAMENKKLCVVVMDYDDFSKDDLIGATQVKLYEVLQSSNYEICIKRLLDDRSVPRSDAIVVDRGAIQLGLNYSMAEKALVVNVIAASNIAGHLPKGECESLVKCYWTTRSLCMKGKTKTSGKTNSPSFSEILHFPASLHELTHSNLTDIEEPSQNLLSEFQSHHK